jgi:hypothetical protein
VHASVPLSGTVRIYYSHGIGGWCACLRGVGLGRSVLNSSVPVSLTDASISSSTRACSAPRVADGSALGSGKQQQQSLHSVGPTPIFSRRMSSDFDDSRLAGLSRRTCERVPLEYP